MRSEWNHRTTSAFTDHSFSGKGDLYARFRL